jgi:hypothetical protein
MNRIGRRWTAAVGVLAIVFAQLAVSAYACGKARAPAAMPMAMSDCERMDPAGLPLCERHCQDEAQAQGAPAPQVADFAPAFVAAVAVPGVRIVAGRGGDALLLHATSPPAVIRHCRLLI